MDTYDSWNNKKKNLSTKKRKILFKESEIWWCSLGMNLGTESFGKGESFQRPVLVIKKLDKESCIGIPLTTRQKTGTWFSEILVFGEKRWAMLYQIRMISTIRFQRRMGFLKKKDLAKVKEKLGALLELFKESSSAKGGIGG